MAPSPIDIFSIGHSRSSHAGFVALLRGAGITAIADVRSSPYSRHVPQFNRETLARALAGDGIAYTHLGNELGGRPKDPALWRNGVADYERMAEAPAFAAGIARLIAGARRHRIALMCAESDPLDCHRCLLVGRALNRLGIDVGHILRDGTIERQSAIEAKLLRSARGESDQADLFEPPADLLAAAYRAHLRRYASASRGSGTTQRTPAGPEPDV